MIWIIPAKQGGVILIDIPEPQYDNEVKGYGHEYVGKLEGGKLDGPFKESQVREYNGLERINSHYKRQRGNIFGVLGVMKESTYLKPVDNAYGCE